MPTYLVGPTQTYTTIQAAINAIPTNLSGTGIHDVIIDAGVYTEQIVISKINGTTNDYVHLRAAVGAEHLFDFNSGVRIVRPSTAGTNPTISASTRFSRYTNLNISRPAVGAQTGYALDLQDRGVTCENVIFQSQGTALNIQFKEANHFFYKCLAYNPAATDGSVGFRDNQSLQSLFVNCGSYGFSVGFYNGGLSSATFINCWAYKINPAGNTLFGPFLFVSPSSRNNASGDTTAHGPNSLTSVSLASMAFVDSASRNFHLQDSSVLIAAGADESARFTTDVDGVLIIIWPIGPDALTVTRPMRSSVLPDTTGLISHARVTAEYRAENDARIAHGFMAGAL